MVFHTISPIKQLWFHVEILTTSTDNSHFCTETDLNDAQSSANKAHATCEKFRKIASIIWKITLERVNKRGINNLMSLYYLC